MLGVADVVVTREGTVVEDSALISSVEERDCRELCVGGVDEGIEMGNGGVWASRGRGRYKSPRS